jgi:hypothetical protein
MNLGELPLTRGKRRPTDTTDAAPRGGGGVFLAMPIAYLARSGGLNASPVFVQNQFALPYAAA